MNTNLCYNAVVILIDDFTARDGAVEVEASRRASVLLPRELVMASVVERADARRRRLPQAHLGVIGNRERSPRGIESGIIILALRDDASAK